MPTGLRGERIRFVPCGDMVAAVGDLESAPEPAEDTLRAHDRAVRRLLASAAAVLPARFGSVLAGEAQLREAISRRSAALGRAAARVRGCRQMTLRLFRPPRGQPRVAKGRAASGEGPGARYLRGRARWLSARDVPDAAWLLDRLAPLVRAERVERHGPTAPARPAPTSSLLASVYHLVPQADLGRYRRALAAACRGARALRVVASGPWPPYAFAPDDLA